MGKSNRRSRVSLLGYIEVAPNPRDCPKSSRCRYGKACPNEYKSPSPFYGCFERRTRDKRIYGDDI